MTAKLLEKDSTEDIVFSQHSFIPRPDTATKQLLPRQHRHKKPSIDLWQYKPRENWEQPVRFLVTKYFDKVVIFSQVKAILVGATPENGGAECLCNNL